MRQPSLFSKSIWAILIGLAVIALAVATGLFFEARQEAKAQNEAVASRFAMVSNAARVAIQTGDWLGFSKSLAFEPSLVGLQINDATGGIVHQFGEVRANSPELREILTPCHTLTPPVGVPLSCPLSTATGQLSYRLTAELKSRDVWVLFGERARLPMVALVTLALASLALIFGLMSKMRLALDSVTQRLQSLGLGQTDQPAHVAPFSELTSVDDEIEHVRQMVSDVQAKYVQGQAKLKRELSDRTKELREASSKAMQLAMIDPLTKLPNRMALARELAERMKKATISQHHVALLFIDIDHFKRLNDSMGHEVGDAVLKHVSQLLSQGLRETDFAARLGGDEFVVVISRLVPLESVNIVQRYVHNLYSHLRRPIEFEDFSTLATLSIGMALFPRDAEDVSGLLRAADAAMYEAKEKGRSRAEWFTPEFIERHENRLQTERNLRQAIAEGDITLVYQPQVDMKTGMPVGMEALVRWRHPVRGNVSPGEFIPLAEDTGLIIPLGEQILRIASDQGAKWASVLNPLRLSINLSVRQLELGDWIEIVQEVIRSSGLAPIHVDFEVTESAISRDPVRMAKTLQQMVDLGFSISLDDFGTGYSSLNYLARMPLQSVKIDRQFISDIDDPAARNIVQSIVALGHALKLRIVAEGVETPHQYNLLRDMGCDEAQGYYVSEPLHADDIPRWWASRMSAVNLFAAPPDLATEIGAREDLPGVRQRKAALGSGRG